MNAHSVGNGCLVIVQRFPTGLVNGCSMDANMWCVEQELETALQECVAASVRKQPLTEDSRVFALAVRVEATAR